MFLRRLEFKDFSYIDISSNQPKEFPKMFLFKSPDTMEWKTDTGFVLTNLCKNEVKLVNFEY